jgi:lysozyme
MSTNNIQYSDKNRYFQPIFRIVIFSFCFELACANSESSRVISPASAEGSGECYGIDVSHHQKHIDWSLVKQWNEHPIQFVYIKATEGTTFQDNAYQRNFTEARKAGFPVGSYHFFRTTSEPQGQFENFIKHVSKDQQDLIPMVDIEEIDNWDKPTFHAKLQEFLDLMEAHFGAKPMIYSVNTFYNRNLSGKYNSYPVLIGRYGDEPPWMKDRRNWTIWQFTETGQVNGIPKRVDIDRLHSEAKLGDLLLRH